jgi:hypothetical protein
MTVRSFVLVVFLPGIASAAELHVGDNETYATIQEAVDAAVDGDAIVVHAGTYEEQVVVDAWGLDHLVIEAYASDVVTIDTPDELGASVVAHTVNLKLKGLTIEAADNQAPHAIDVISDTGPGEQVFQLTLCDVSLDDHDTTGGIAIACNPDPGDVLNVRGYDVTITDFATSVGGACGYSNGWDFDNYICMGW